MSVHVGLEMTVHVGLVGLEIADAISRRDSESARRRRDRRARVWKLIPPALGWLTMAPAANVGLVPDRVG